MGKGTGRPPEAFAKPQAQVSGDQNSNSGPPNLDAPLEIPSGPRVSSQVELDHQFVPPAFPGEPAATPNEPTLPADTQTTEVDHRIVELETLPDEHIKAVAANAGVQLAEPYDRTQAINALVQAGITKVQY